MAKYEITHSCGHEQTHQIIGRSSDRKRRIGWLETTFCADCYKEQLEQAREAEAQKARAEAEDIGLSELEGTEKQVRWAEQMRGRFIENAEKLAGGDAKLLWPVLLGVRDYGHSIGATVSIQDIEGGRDALPELLGPPLGRLALQWAASMNHASDWIDSRDLALHGFAARNKSEIVAIIVAVATGATPEEVTAQQQVAAAEKELEREAQRQAEIEATLMPEEPTTPLVAEIRIEGASVAMFFPEPNQTVNGVVKSLGYQWERPAWRKDARVIGGKDHRAAELANRLLAAGVPVLCYNEAVRNAAVSGEFEPEPSVWITTRSNDAEKYPGWFNISWKREVNFYQTAKRLPGSQYAKPWVAVPPKAWEELEDFAEAHGCKLLSPALELIEKERAAELAKIRVEPAPAPESEVKPVGGQKLAVPETVEIPEDLLDE